MFSFLKKSNSSNSGDYFPFTTDIHSHILSGIDDGAQTIEDSLQLIKGLMQLGVKRSVATPHIIGDLYPNTPATITAALEKLRAALKEEGIDFEVSAAAEYMLDGYFFELLSKKEKLLTLKDNIILTEFPFTTLPNYMEKVAFDILTEGYQPILAHPERYMYAHGNTKMYHRWKDLGFKLQVNLLSLTGGYGKDVARAAKYILKHELSSYVATDLHHMRHIQGLQDKRNRALFHEILQHNEWNAVFN